MTAHTHDRIAPPGALALGTGLVAISLLLVTSVRLGLVEPSPSAADQRVAAKMAPAAERMLRFSDQPDGTVLITDARTGAAIDTIRREDGGFVRGVMRGLARERRQHRIGSEPPFRLTGWTNGALSLTDPATGRVIELDGFGHTNRGAFARLLGKGTAR
jgi:putative photosynthetic complex assembly protein